MDVCIISNINDDHAIMVERALLQKGSRVYTWYWPDFPSVERLSVGFDETGAQTLPMRDQLTGGCSLWIHRGMHPVAPAWLHKADQPFVRNECLEFLHGLLDRIALDAYCLNPIAPARRYRYKINQLDLASRCGFLIPPTLISNDPARIREFATHHANRIVVKHATQMAWQSCDNQIFVPYTSRVSRAQLNNDLQLQACPSIFQAEIAKQFELRIVFIGLNLFALKIDSQQQHDMIDWRNNNGELPPCSRYDLPAGDKAKLLSMIHRSGLLHGSIDAIVDRHDRLVFIELNESGRFLWMEEVAPSLPLLDCFCEFLIRQDPQMSYQPGDDIVTVNEFSTYVRHCVIEERGEGHVPQPNLTRLRE